jgi:hypothetical protein
MCWFWGMSVGKHEGASAVSLFGKIDLLMCMHALMQPACLLLSQ